MTRSVFQRAGFAASALLISLAAVVGFAAPAQAAPDTLVVTTPTNGSTTSSRTVTVAGTGTPGAAVALGDANDLSVVYGTAPVLPDSSWTFDIVFASNAPTAQSVIAVQADPSDTVNPLAGDETVSFNLPAPVTTPPSAPLVVTSPADNSTSTSRIIQFTGTVPVGSTVVTTLDDGTVQIPSAQVDGAGNFIALGQVPFTGSDTRTFTLSGADASGNPFTPVDITVTVPAAIAPPVIESPVDGASIATTQLTLSGTGVAGRNIFVLALSDSTTLDDLQMADAMNAADPIVVDSSGRWSVTLPVTPGTYAAVALHTSTPTPGSPVEAASLPSNVPTFTITAPVVVAQLANTGTDPMTVAGVGAGFLLAGLLLVASRRARLRLPSIR